MRAKLDLVGTKSLHSEHTKTSEFCLPLFSIFNAFGIEQKQNRMRLWAYKQTTTQRNLTSLSRFTFDSEPQADQVCVTQSTVNPRNMFRSHSLSKSPKNVLRISYNSIQKPPTKQSCVWQVLTWRLSASWSHYASSFVTLSLPKCNHFFLWTITYLYGSATRSCVHCPSVFESQHVQKVELSTKASKMRTTLASDLEASWTCHHAGRHRQAPLILFRANRVKQQTQNWRVFLFRESIFFGWDHRNLEHYYQGTDPRFQPSQAQSPRMKKTNNQKAKQSNMHFLNLPYRVGFFMHIF